MLIVDTEFLFGLNPADRHHNGCRKILEDLSNQLIIPGFAVFEFVLVMLSRKKNVSEARAALEALQKITLKYKVREAKIGLEEIIEGLRVLETYPTKTFFDGMMVAAALLADKEIIGNDESFENVFGLKVQGIPSINSPDR